MPTTTDLQQLPVARIRRSSLNPRKGRNVARYEAFKASVASQGVLQAIVVRPVSGDPDHDFEIVAGETRWTASIDCGLAYIPALVREMSDAEARIAAVVENVQRADMTPIEEARAAATLLVQTGNDYDEVMSLLGWSRTKLNARVLLTHASESVEKALLEGSIKLGHAELLCPLGQADQDMVLGKIIETGMGVSEARERLMKLTRRLDQAVFDTAGCNGCAHNSSAYADLFDSSVTGGQCQNLTCWSEKIAAHLDACVTEAKAEFGIVYRADEVPANGYQIIATDGAKGVGQDQAAACRSCQSYGAIIDTRNGSEGKVAGRYCFNGACHAEKVTTYQSLIAAAAATPEAPAGASKTGAANASGSAKGASAVKTAAPSKKTAKPNALRPSHKKAQHKAFVKLAHRHFSTSLNYAYAQAISCVCGDVGKDVQNGLVDKALKSAGVPTRPYGAKDRAGWVADLALLDQTTLIALLARLASLSLCRTVTNDDFANSEASVMAGLMIERHQLDPRAVFVVNEEYLTILTKEELQAECEASGFAAAYETATGKGSFKKLANGKVAELKKAMLAPLAGFTWEGYLPALMTPAHLANASTDTADSTPAVTTQAA